MRRVATAIIIFAPLFGCSPDDSHKASQAAANKPDTKASVQVAATNWTVDRRVSQLDGSKTFVAQLPSTNFLPNSVGSPDHAKLLIRCANSQLEAYIIWPPFIGTEAVQVRYRFDQGPIDEHEWTTSQDGTSTFAPNPQWFLLEVSRSSKLVVNAPVYNEANVEAVFELRGGSDVAAKARIECPPPPHIAQVYGTNNRSARVVLRISGETQVMVSMGGVVSLHRVLEAGDSYMVPNLAGGTLTAGDGSALSIEVDGKPVGKVSAQSAPVFNVSIDADELLNRLGAPHG